MAGAESNPDPAYRSRARIALALAGLAGLITIDAGFVFDDHLAIEHNPVVNGRVPAWEAVNRDFWGKPLALGSVASYRPLMSLLWRGLWALWPHPLPFHALSLVLHVAATAAFLFAGRRLVGAQAWLGGAAIVFAVHAAHAEAVGANVSHADLLSTAIGLLVLGLSARATGLRAGVALAAAVAAACLFKESAFVFAGAAMAVIALRRAPLRERAALLLPIALVTVLVIALQLSLERENDPRYSLTLAYDARGWDRLLLGLAFYARGVVICFAPHGLAPKHSYAAWDLSAETLLPYAIPGALLLALSVAALSWAIARRHAALTAGLILLVGPCLINTGLIVQVPNEVPERTYYAATMAASALIALLVLRLARGRARNELVLLAAIALAMSVQRYRAQRPWHDELALWQYAIEVEPKSAELQMFMAHAREQSGHTDEAIWHAIVTAYVASQRPRRVEWQPIEALERLPLPERWLRAPAVLSADRPCRFALGMLGVLRSELRSLERPALGGYRARYPSCFAALPGAGRGS